MLFGLPDAILAAQERVLSWRLVDHVGHPRVPISEIRSVHSSFGSCRENRTILAQFETCCRVS